MVRKEHDWWLEWRLELASEANSRLVGYTDIYDENTVLVKIGTALVMVIKDYSSHPVIGITDDTEDKYGFPNLLLLDYTTVQEVLNALAEAVEEGLTVAQFVAKYSE